MRAFFAVTDPQWLAAVGAIGGGEANFWQPKRPTRIGLEPGTPWIFKVRRTDRIGGFGFFMYWTAMPIAVAWETFGVGNGAASLAEMETLVRRVRGGAGEFEDIGCVVLSNVVVLPEHRFVASPSDWKPNIVRVAGYDLGSGEGARVWNQLRALDTVADEVGFSPLVHAGGYGEPALVAARRGQGAFRLMVMDAYARRCAITGERTLPVLEAAHIKPFSQDAKHEVRNGILMRSDIHRLYDRGLVTVDSDSIFRVSPAIERDYSNGKIYYALDGKPIAVPANDIQRPDPSALAWHEEHVFRR